VVLYDVAGIDELCMRGDFQLGFPRRFDLPDRIEYRSGKKVTRPRAQDAFRRFGLPQRAVLSRPLASSSSATPYRSGRRRSEAQPRRRTLLIELSDQRAIRGGDVSPR